MMVAPVTFLAIISGITKMSDAVDIGKLGAKLLSTSVVMLLAISLLSLGLSLVMFSGDLSYMQAGIPSTADAAASQYGSIKDMIFDIVPDNLVEPLKGKKILQVMFLAIFFGVVINRMGDKARGATECLDFLFQFTVGALKLIVQAIPLIVFLSMASLLASTGVDSIITFSQILFGLFIGIFLIWLVNAAATMLFAKISPVNLIKKLAAFAPIIFPLPSSNATLPFVLKFCTEKLGVDPKLTAFSIPVGLQLNKAGHCVYFALVTVMMMRVFGIDMNSNLLVTLYFSIVIMSIAKPSIPCGSLICLSYLFLTAGVPTDAVAVILCIEPVAAMFFVVCNGSANITSTFILARSVNLLDEKKYFADN